MRLNLRLASVVVAITLIPFSTEGQTAGREDPSKQLEVIAQRVQDGTITRIEILALPNSILTRARITPQGLRKSGEVVSIRDLAEIRNSFVAALRKTQAVSFNKETDLRRGVIFYSKDNEVFSIYYDKFAQGNTNGKGAKFTGALISWVNSRISPEYR